METTPQVNEDEQEEKTNVVPFQVLQGGKLPPGDNWLKDIPPATKFIAQEKGSKTCICYEFMVGYHTEFCTYLLVYPGQMEMLVITAQFSETYERIEVLPDDKFVQTE